jgi:S-methylmethionine-dependent homocysteine/selenocysteine methylase
MSKYRDQLPQLSEKTFITDGGLETTLIFHHGYDLPEFAAFDLFKQSGGYEILRNYFTDYATIAKTHQTGYILESPTWRASREWGEKIGYSPKDLKEINRLSIAMLEEIRARWEDENSPMVISGNIGPRGDGYSVEDKMTARQAQQYHSEQIRTFSQTEADQVSAFTINYVEEAIGITRAAREAGMPAVISFTVETDGRLPTGQPLGEAIAAVDRTTAGGPAYYMINCAHPTHFENTLAADAPWLERLRAIRANASAKSHAELDEATELDAGDPHELGRSYADMKACLPRLNIFGGCCGTDHRHLAAISRAVTSTSPACRQAA